MRHGFVPARDRGSVHVPSRHPPFLRATERTIADVTTHRALPLRIFVDFQNVFTVPHKNAISAKLPAHHVALPARRVRSQRFLPALVTTHASVVVVQPSTLLVVPGDEELPLRFSIAQVRNLPLRVDFLVIRRFPKISFIGHENVRRFLSAHARGRPPRLFRSLHRCCVFRAFFDSLLG